MPGRSFRTCLRWPARHPAADAGSVSPFLSCDADQLSAPARTGSAVSPEPSGLGLKKVPQQSGALQSDHPLQTVNDGIKVDPVRCTRTPSPFPGPFSRHLATAVKRFLATFRFT